MHNDMSNTERIKCNGVQFESSHIFVPLQIHLSQLSGLRSSAILRFFSNFEVEQMALNRNRKKQTEILRSTLFAEKIVIAVNSPTLCLISLV